MTPEERAEARRLPEDTLNMLLSHLEAHSPQTVASIARHIDSLMDALEAAERERDGAQQIAAKQIDVWVKGASQKLIDQRDTARAQVEALAEALQSVLKSATPNPNMHPSMSVAWDRARAALRAAGVEA